MKALEFAVSLLNFIENGVSLDFDDVNLRKLKNTAKQREKLDFGELTVSVLTILQVNSLFSLKNSL